MELQNTAIRLGTSAFMAAGWKGSFYPRSLPSREYLRYYAEHFDTVEIDSTYYRVPSASTVRSWYDRTPKDFLFAAKIPQTITHEKVLSDCGADVSEFLRAMDGLREKLGPLLFQFPYFDVNAFRTQEDFIEKLQPFLRGLPRDYQFAVEVRNRNWLDEKLAVVLREHGVALVLADRDRLTPTPEQLFSNFNPLTANFAYIRWLGDRKGMERTTMHWDKVVVDRTPEMTEWVRVCARIADLKIPIMAYANNHYAGHSPATLEMFRALWNAGSNRPPIVPVKPALGPLFD